MKTGCDRKCEIASELSNSNLSMYDARALCLKYVVNLNGCCSIVLVMVSVARLSMGF